MEMTQREDLMRVRRFSCVQVDVSLSVFMCVFYRVLMLSVIILYNFNIIS